jgi:hypothetical protein
MADRVFTHIREGLRLRKPIGYQALTRGNARFVRVGQNLYLSGDADSLSDFVDRGTFEDFEEVLNENQIYNPEVIENIELDEIELNSPYETEPLIETSFSATPALAEAGGIAGAAGSTLPSAGAIVTGVSIAGATVVLGTTAGVLSNRNSDTTHKDPVVSLPGHHYIGPGNTIDDISPIDVDDHIAREHDIRYENARTQEDIHEADREGANEFLTDIIHNQNLHSVAGYIGLKAKEGVERVVGVQYPSNLPISPSGMSKVKAPKVTRVNGKYHVDRDPSRHPEFPTNRGQRLYAWARWNEARAALGLQRVDPPPRFNLETTHRPPINSDGTRPSSASIPYQTWRDQRREARQNRGPLLDSLDDDPNTEDIDQLMVDIAETLPDPPISSSDYDNRDGAGPSNAGPSHSLPDNDVEMAEPRTRAGQKRMRDGAYLLPDQEAGAAATTGAGHNSANDGGFDSAQGPVVVLPHGGYQTEAGSMTFKKVHRMKSFAIPYWKLVDATTRGGSWPVSTPLAKIPWEYACFYMSPDEFALIPAGSYIDRADIFVTQTVASTGYPTGGTTASVATTNHPKVLCVGKDLEAKNRGGYDRLLTINSSMIPSIPAAGSSVQSFLTDFVAKQYGTDQSVATNAAVTIPGCAHKIPYYNKCHWLIYQPNNTQATARNFTAATSPGFEYFQNYITETNANDTPWDYVHHTSYKFTSAPIGDQFRSLELLAENVTQSTGNAQYYNAKRTVSGTNPLANTSISETYVPSSRTELPIVTYQSAPMEKGSYFVKGDAAHKPARQPSFHIGMRAIDKMAPETPGSRAVEFVQANIEFEITATLTIRLPSYPNRFVRPKFYNTSIENAVQGIANYPAYVDPIVTFGLLNESSVAPAVAAVDATDENNLIENNRSLPANVSRPVRSLPSVPAYETSRRPASRS